MHVDLHEHGCKDKEETEQAVTDDICREVYRGTINCIINSLQPHACSTTF